MIYILFIFISCGYLSVLRNYRVINFRKTLLYGLPVILLWCLLVGGQYNVGADYFSYMEMFVPGSNLGYVNNRGEYAFSWFIETCQSIGIYGQGIFFVIALVWCIIFLYISYSLVGSKYIYLFLFVYVVFSGGFNNQMNGIRQYFAMYVLWLAITFFWKRHNLSSITLFVVVPFFHQSSLAIMAILPIFYYGLIGWSERKWLYGILATGMVCSILISDKVIVYFLPYFDQYSDFLNSDLLGDQDPLLILTKYVYLPLFLYAIFLFPKMDLDVPYKRIFVFGLCGYALRLSVLTMSLVSRLGGYLLLFSCIPLVYLLIYLKREKRNVLYYLILIYLLLPYGIKVLMFARWEYTYRFFLFSS